MMPQARGLVWAVAAAVAIPSVAGGQNPRPTYYRDVLPIFQNNCQVCHRPKGANMAGMVAPFSLIDYEEVRPWAKSIATEVAARRMPPWFAAPEFSGVFELERHLTDAQIDTIVRWSQTGAARGNPADAPPPATFPSAEGWTMGEPDLVIPIPEPYWVADDVTDIQPSFSHYLTEEELPEDRWIEWIEFRPGSDVVHHGGAATYPVDENREVVVDPLSGGKIIGTAPGDGPDVWPVGYGKLVRKGALIRFNIHYHKEPGENTGKWDRSSIAIKWHTEPVKYIVRAAGVSSRGWEVPPFHGDWRVGATRLFEQDSMIINLMPHMHYRGKAARYEALYPDGSREVLLDVPQYDYNWQMTYTFKEPKFIPAGTRLNVSMWFDNSRENAVVPDPENAVGFGSMTDDEMNIGWTEYANATPVEDILKANFGTQGTGVEDVADTGASATRARAAFAARRGRGGGGGQPRLTLNGAQITIRSGATPAASPLFEALATARPGDVVALSTDAAIKLTTETDLKFGDAVLKRGNAYEDYPGVYSLWLKRTASGWSLVANDQPDVLGTQHDPAHDVAEWPLQSGTADEAAARLSVRLEESGDGGRLSLAWGEHLWISEFEAAGDGRK